MELILKSAELNLPQSIANLEQLKAELEPRLEKYNSLVVTEDSIKAAKEDKAALNKLKKAIEEQRISKWGIMSIEMQRAVESDMGVISENGSVDYIDAPAAEHEEVVDVQPEQPTQNEASFEDILRGASDE